MRVRFPSSDFLIPVEPASIRLKVKLPSDFGTKIKVIHYRIDDTHSNAYTKWLKLGSPQNPDAQVFAQLTTAMGLQMLEPTKLIDITNNEATLSFELPRFGLSLIVLNKQ